MLPHEVKLKRTPIPSALTVPAAAVSIHAVLECAGYDSVQYERIDQVVVITAGLSSPSG